MATSPNLSVGSLHVPALLDQMTIGYHPTGLVGEQLFPVVRVKHETDFYLVWDKAQAARLERTDGQGFQRADGTVAKEVNFGGTFAQYSAKAYAARVKVTDRELANADSAFNLVVSKTRRAQDLVLLEQELLIAQLLTTTGNYASTNFVTLAGVNQWNNASFVSQSGATQSIIKQNIDAGKEAIRQQTLGMEANTIVIPAAVARVLARDVGIFEQVKYTHPDLLVGGYLPPVLWGMKVLVPNAIDTTTAEGEATITYSDVWGKNVVLAYVNQNPGQDSLTAGVIFRSQEWQTRSYRQEDIAATYYEAQLVQAPVLVANSAAYLINAAIA